MPHKPACRLTLLQRKKPFPDKNQVNKNKTRHILPACRKNHNDRFSWLLLRPHSSLLCRCSRGSFPAPSLKTSPFPTSLSSTSGSLQRNIRTGPERYKERGMMCRCNKFSVTFLETLGAAWSRAVR